MWTNINQKEVSKSVTWLLPDVERNKEDSRNSIGVVLKVTDDFYEIGRSMENCLLYILANQIEKFSENLLLTYNVLKNKITFHNASNKESQFEGGRFH